MLINRIQWYVPKELEEFVPNNNPYTEGMKETLKGTTLEVPSFLGFVTCLGRTWAFALPQANFYADKKASMDGLIFSMHTTISNEFYGDILRSLDDIRQISEEDPSRIDEVPAELDLLRHKIFKGEI